MVFEETFVKLLQADNIGIGCVQEADQLVLFLFIAFNIADVEGYDGYGCVGKFVAVIVVTEMDGAVVEDVAANKERSNNRHPYQSSMEQKPKEDEEYVNNQKDGECQSEERKPRHNVWRDECQCHTQP